LRPSESRRRLLLVGREIELDTRAIGIVDEHLPRADAFLPTVFVRDALVLEIATVARNPVAVNAMWSMTPGRSSLFGRSPTMCSTAWPPA
jgi:hypothetical protein